MTHTDRRSFLKSAAAGAAGVSLLPALAGAAGAERKTKRVVLIAFAGGVRTRETFGTPGNVPNMKAMADQGVLYTRAKTANLGHFGASMSLFTGISEARGIRENARGTDPTDLRVLAARAWGWRAERCVGHDHRWRAADELLALACTPQYGPQVTARRPWTVTASSTRSSRMSWRHLRHAARRCPIKTKLRSWPTLRGETCARQRRLQERETLARVESYILEELTQAAPPASLVPTPGDAKALRLARNLMSPLQADGHGRRAAER